MSLDYKTYIIEWLDLVNIMSYPYDKIKITGSERDNRGEIINIKDDECFNIKNIAECDKNEKCQSYTSKKTKICISKTNLSNYLPSTSAIPNIFIPIGSNNRYEIIDAEIITESIFYKIFKSKNTEIVYILFPTGDTSINLNTPEINIKLENLINKIMNFKKIVIAGHSMGCMMALHFASILYQKNMTLFQEKCVVLGTGPYKGYQSSYVLPNTKIFVLVYAYENSLYVDEFLYEGNYKNYIPALFINDTTIPKESNYNHPDFLTTINSKQKISPRDIHDLKRYKKTLQYLLNNNDFILYINNDNLDNTLTNTIITNVVEDTNAKKYTTGIMAKLSNWLLKPGGKNKSKKNKSKKNKFRKTINKNVLKRK
jgi:hypothetical protein